jgi:DNA-directed RNA polymerase specialized sigma24 family protein
MPRTWSKPPIYFDAFWGGNFRVWLLTIVRNTFITWVKENRSGRVVFVPDTPLAQTSDTDENRLRHQAARPRGAVDGQHRQPDPQLAD